MTGEPDMPSDVMMVAEGESTKEEKPQGRPTVYRYVHTIIVRKNAVIAFHFRRRKGDNGKSYRLLIQTVDDKFVQRFFSPDDLKVHFYQDNQLVGALADTSKFYFQAERVRLEVIGQGVNTRYILKVHLHGMPSMPRAS